MEGTSKPPPPLTWSCMMQLDSTAAPSSRQHWYQPASERPSPANRPAGHCNPRTTPSTGTTPHTQLSPLPDLVVRPLRVLCFTHFCAPPRQLQTSEPVYFLGGRRGCSSKCVSQRTGLACGSHNRQPWAHRVPKHVCCAPHTYFYFTGSHVRSASSTGEKNMCLLFL